MKAYNTSLNDNKDIFEKRFIQILANIIDKRLERRNNTILYNLNSWLFWQCMWCSHLFEICVVFFLFFCSDSWHLWLSVTHNSPTYYYLLPNNDIYFYLLQICLVFRRTYHGKYRSQFMSLYRQNYLLSTLLNSLKFN